MCSRRATERGRRDTTGEIPQRGDSLHLYRMIGRWDGSEYVIFSKGQKCCSPIIILYILLEENVTSCQVISLGIVELTLNV